MLQVYPLTKRLEWLMLPPIDDSELPVGQAESLAHHKGDLSLNNYTVISSEAAVFLGQFSY